jgi:hypothetical protein
VARTSVDQRRESIAHAAQRGEARIEGTAGRTPSSAGAGAALRVTLDS